MDELTADQKFKLEAEENAANARKYGVVFIIAGIALQTLHLFTLPIRGFQFMLIISFIILVGAGILFILGSYTVPEERSEFIERLQKIMLDHNPDRRLWAAQRLVGYAKKANFTDDEILNLVRHAVKMVKDPSVSEAYKDYVSVDHIIFLRELSVNVDMDKHTRKDFVRIVRPLQKLDIIDEDAASVLADAISYHPDKLPIQAYADLRKQKEELEKE